MRSLKPVFDILYERRRLLLHELDIIRESILPLQTVCKHERHFDSTNCMICGKLLDASDITKVVFNPDDN